MNILDLQKIAYEGLSTNKIRSGLTALGVIIGVLAVVLLVSIGEGVKQDVSSQIQGLGSNLIIVIPGKIGGVGSGRGAPAKMSGGGLGGTSKLTYEHSLKIERKNNLNLKVGPMIMSKATVKYKKKSMDTSIAGVVPQYCIIRNYKITEGKFIDDFHLRSSKKVCTIGETVRQELFGKISPANKDIIIKGQKFKIIGVMDKKGYLGAMNLDDQIFIPLTTAQKLFGINNLSLIDVQVPSSEIIEQAQEEVKKILKKDLQEDDFSLLTQAEILETFSSIMAIFTIMLGSIAGISLLVGGIGIMNIMLVTVVERTKEIGLRKAIGAQDEDILFQFLLEAITLSIAGGIIGIILGIIGAHLLKTFTTLTPVITWWSVLLAFFFSLLVGVFFGVYPAHKASKLDPIVALRYE